MARLPIAVTVLAAMLPALPAAAQSSGSARVVVLRAQQTSSSAEPVSVSIDGVTVGTLVAGTYLAADAPPGANSLSAALVLSRVIANFDLAAGETAYVAVSVRPAGLPPPAQDGALSPPPETAGGESTLSLQFMDESTAMSALAGLAPAP